MGRISLCVISLNQMPILQFTRLVACTGIAGRELQRAYCPSLQVTKRAQSQCVIYMNMCNLSVCHQTAVMLRRLDPCAARLIYYAQRYKVATPYVFHDTWVITHAVHSTVTAPPTLSARKHYREGKITIPHHLLEPSPTPAIYLLKSKIASAGRREKYRI